MIRTERSLSTGRRAARSNPVGSVDQGQSGNPIPSAAVKQPVTAELPQSVPGFVGTAHSGFPIKQNRKKRLEGPFPLGGELHARIQLDR